MCGLVETVALKKKRQNAEVEAAVNVSIGGDRDGEDGKWPVFI